MSTQSSRFIVFALLALVYPVKGWSQLTTSSFVPVLPCRIADTRNATGPFGGPSLLGGTTRTFPVSESACGLPPSATAYSLNVTVVPAGPLSYLTIWPTGQSRPVVSTLNSPVGQIVANAATVPAGINGQISVYVTDITDVIIDVNGYFGPSDGGNGVLNLRSDNANTPSGANPTFQSMYSSPGIVLQAGGTGPSTDALMGIFFNAFNAGSQATRAVLAGRSGGNWGELSFHTQYGGDGILYERVRIDSAGNVGIGTSNPDSKLDVTGIVHSTSGGFMFPDGTIQRTAQATASQGPPGPQGPAGPAGSVIHSSAICTNNATGPVYNGGCTNRTLVLQVVLGASCSVTADTGSCTAAGSTSIGGLTQTLAVCAVCLP